MGQSPKCRVRNRMAVLNRYSIYLILFVIVSSCNKDRGSGCFTREGDEVIVERQLGGNFKTLEIYDNAVVTIKQGSEYKAIVKGGEKLIDSYKTTVENGHLIIENRTICNWTRDLSTAFEVTVIMPEIDSILYFGFGEINTYGQILVDSLYIESRNGYGYINMDVDGQNMELIIHYGGGVNIEMRGSMDKVLNYTTAHSIINMSQLEATRGWYICRGTGDITINTSEYIKVELDLTGNIYYTKDPEVYIKSQTGSGKLIHY